MPEIGQPVRSAWTRTPATGTRQPPLTRGRIVSEAMRLLDAEGIDALSMRRLGALLNSGATSIYTHVANKDELIELVVDAAYGEMAVPDPADPAGWRVGAAACARNLRALILRHPWIVSVLGETGLAYLGPNMMALAEGMLGLFETAGLPSDEADLAMSTLVAYVIGRCASEVAWLQAVSRSGEDEREWVRRLWPSAVRAAQPYPRLRQRYAEERHQDAQVTRETSFDYGLERLLDGLQIRIATR